MPQPPESHLRFDAGSSNFGSLNRLWKSKEVSRRTKARLYKAIILPVMLYNAEVWPVTAQDIKALEGAHFRMLRRMLNSSEDARISRNQLFRALNMTSVNKLLSQMRLRWLGHALRRDDRDRSKIAVLAALEDNKCAWTKLIKQDCRDFGIKFKNLRTLVMDRPSFRHVTHVGMDANSP